MSTLSVETSNSGSSASTWSPSCLSQRVMVPSVIDSPSSGMVTVVVLPPPDASALGFSASAFSALGSSSGSSSACSSPSPASAASDSRSSSVPASSLPSSASAASSDSSACSLLALSLRLGLLVLPALVVAAALAVLLDDGQLGADLDRLVGLHLDGLQDPGDGGRDLGVDLVGGHLEQGLVGLDPVALLLDPPGDGALGDRLAELRHLDWCRH